MKSWLARRLLIDFPIKHVNVSVTRPPVRQHSTWQRAEVNSTGLPVTVATRLNLSCDRTVDYSTRPFHLSSICPAEFVDFKLADIGEGINEVIVKEWFVKVGDQVRQFDSICEVQSDKASVTITSRFDGKITKLYYETDDMAAVGKPLVELQIESAGKMVDEVNDQDAHTSPQPQVNTAGPDENSKNASSSTDCINLAGGGDKVLTTPAVRRLAAEHQINLADVMPTGKEGRVLKEDVLRYIEQTKSAVHPSTSPASPPPTPPSVSSPTASSRRAEDLPAQGLSAQTSTNGSFQSVGSGLRISSPSLQADQVHRLKGVQKAMAKSMTAALQIPQFGLSDELNLNKMVKLRGQLKKQAEHRRVHLSYLPFFIKAASLALKQFPTLNAHFDADQEQITYRAAHNIGVAVDSPSGLVVPNIKQVQELTIFEIADQLNRLQALATGGQLSSQELTGGTFTLSNIGSIGGSFGIPVILPPEVAIGAIGRIREVPRFDEKDHLVKAQVLNVVWCADHRVIDGATMTRFNNLWKSYIENPLLMISELK